MVAIAASSAASTAITVGPEARRKLAQAASALSAAVASAETSRPSGRGPAHRASEPSAGTLAKPESGDDHRTTLHCTTG